MDISSARQIALQRWDDLAKVEELADNYGREFPAIDEIDFDVQLAQALGGGDSAAIDTVRRFLLDQYCLYVDAYSASLCASYKSVVLDKKDDLSSARLANAYEDSIARIKRRIDQRVQQKVTTFDPLDDIAWRRRVDGIARDVKTIEAMLQEMRSLIIAVEDETRKRSQLDTATKSLETSGKSLRRSAYALGVSIFFGLCTGVLQLWNRFDPPSPPVQPQSTISKPAENSSPPNVPPKIEQRKDDATPLTGAKPGDNPQVSKEKSLSEKKDSPDKGK
jgi:hypothetical protein